MSRADELTDMIAPLIESFEYRLWNLTITKAQKRSIVTVTLDKDGGANLDEMAGISKEIASLIDEHPSFENEYHLEVESPGLERSLTNIEHFKWSINMEVSVSFRDGEIPFYSKFLGIRYERVLQAEGEVFETKGLLLWLSIRFCC